MIHAYLKWCCYRLLTAHHFPIKSHSGVTGASVDIPNGGVEGPSMFKRNGIYYILVGVGCCACRGGSNVVVRTNFRSRHRLRHNKVVICIDLLSISRNTPALHSSAYLILIVPLPAGIHGAQAFGPLHAAGRRGQQHHKWARV